MNTRIALVVIALLAVLAGGYALSVRDQGAMPEPVTQTAQSAAESVAMVETGAGDAAEPATEAPGTQEPGAEEPAAEPAAIDVEAALAPRALGDPDAPVRIEEFASLTCSHCADFYKNTFPGLKEKYIDTGKVYFVYTDFPLNAPALEATMVARCLPEDSYFRYIKFLFETQDQWAYDRQYRDYLRENAKLLGLGEQEYHACVTSERLKNDLAANMDALSSRYDVKSTPTFVINNGAQKIVGSQPLNAFEQVLAPLLEKSEQTE